ncbi:hypothetical protein ACFCZ3_09650 [Cellulosimicrobium cellulans]|uniref:hypothetical protein n=1 Tax=Cellulosimicrobium cellulans TaxID=1710 RepID=UPI0035E25675
MTSRATTATRRATRGLGRELTGMLLVAAIAIGAALAVVGVWKWFTTTHDVSLAHELNRDGVAVEATDAVLVVEGKSGSDGVQVGTVTARVPGLPDPVELRGTDGATSAQGVDPAAVEPPVHLPAPSGSPYAGVFAAVQDADAPGTVMARSDLDRVVADGAEDAARSLRTALVGLAWAGLWSLVVWAVVARRRRTLRRADH